MKFNIKKFYESHKDKINELKNFFLIVFGYGILINYTLLVIIDTPFTWYSFPAFGIIYYFIMEEFVVFFRKLKARIIT
jgi:hypothetical protein